MMNKFRVGAFGSPSRVKGISRPMETDLSSLGKMTFFGAIPPGRSIPAESYARQMPKMPVYRNMPRIPGDGYDGGGINPHGMYFPRNPGKFRI